MTKVWHPSVRYTMKWTHNLETSSGHAGGALSWSGSQPCPHYYYYYYHCYYYYYYY